MWTELKSDPNHFVVTNQFEVGVESTVLLCEASCLSKIVLATEIAALWKLYLHFEFRDILVSCIQVRY